MKKIYVIFIFVIKITILFGQKESNIWFFGSHAGLDFNSGSPVELLNGMTNTNEGTAAISNANGSLLFYTDGITVWDKNHIIMPNGNGLFGGNSSTQSALIVPHIGTNLYYIFTVQDDANTTFYLSYSIVDMTLNNGNGDITSKNIVLMSQASEKLTAVKHSNGTDVWVFTHGNGSNSFFGFLVDQNGVNVVPVVSSIGLTFMINDDTIGQMKFSPDGTKIAIAAWGTNFVELFDFNATTGVLTNNKFLNFPAAMNNVYGLEFSPAGNYLYASSITPGNIYQWDITSNSATTINSSMQLIGNPGAIFCGAMQLGPDSKIYITKQPSSTLSVINSPDLGGILCNFSANAIQLSGFFCRVGLPNFIQSDFLSTEVHNLDFENELDILPNPFINTFSIAIKSQNQAVLEIEILTISGEIIFHKQKFELDRNVSKIIDLSSIPGGIYILRGIKDESTFVRKIVKLKY